MFSVMHSDLVTKVTLQEHFDLCRHKWKAEFSGLIEVRKAKYEYVTTDEVCNPVMSFISCVHLLT